MVNFKIGRKLCAKVVFFLKKKSLSFDFNIPTQALKETSEKTKEGLSTGGLKRSHLEMQDQLKKNHAKVQEGERAFFLEYCSICFQCVYREKYAAV